MSHYKINDKKIVQTVALAMGDMSKINFGSKFGDIKPSLQSLEPYKQLFLKQTAPLSQDNIKDLFGYIEELDKTANAALQTLLLVSAMSLTGTNLMD